MIYNYLKVAIRNLKKYKFISFINIFGLTVGLTCCLLILIYILHELSYDNYHPNVDRVYRVTRTFNDAQTGTVSLRLSTVAPPFGPLLQFDFKEIENMTRVLQNGPTPVRYEEKMFNEPNVFLADDQFFDFFSTHVLKGNPSKGLADPYTVMLTDDIAKKYFGTEEPMGKTLRINPGGAYFDFKVTGIFKPFPSNTHFHPDILVSFSTLRDTLIYGEQNLKTNFGNNSFFTYIRLPEHYDPNKLIAQFPAFLDRNMPRDGGGGKFKPSQGTSLSLQKVTDIHLKSHTDYEAEENGDINRVYIFSAIALFILLIACINYMNLSTARSTLRAREIGIRKVVGARKKEIMLQFLSESVLVSWLAMLLAFGCTWLVIPWLNKISGQTLSLNIILKWQLIVPIILIPFVVGILSGLYPAMFMASFQPIKTLKGFLKIGGKTISFRKALVILQFGISIILIICTSIVFSQMSYMQSKALGYDREHIITLPYPSELSQQFDAFRNDLLANSYIKNVARSSRIPTGRLLDAMGARMVSGDTLAPITTNVKFVMTDENFIPTYGVKMAAGRSFSKDFGTDTTGFLINETAASVLGFKNNQDVIGKDFGYGNRTGKLIGVFHDFNFESLHERIVPLIMLVPKNANNYNVISVKATGAGTSSALSTIEHAWKKYLPETPYQYTFLDERFSKLYSAEERQMTLFSVFACLAIFIACLGLFGLSAFAISQRIKEIGIRKVLGASVSTIVLLLSQEFLKLVAVSAVIAFIVASYAMNEWLQDFAYRISMLSTWWIFIVAGIIAAIVALVTISFQAIRAALANPVKSLRTE
jgi:putative ABC transport system permease protein